MANLVGGKPPTFVFHVSWDIPVTEFANGKNKSTPITHIPASSGIASFGRSNTLGIVNN
jgi:hypothetical protein